MARMLIVEDNAHNLELMIYLLSAAGYDIVSAGTGEDGLQAAEREHPDLVILDLQLPDTDGYAVLERMRTLPGLARVPVVAVTAYAMVGDRDLALTAGFDGYVSKPIDPRTFAQTITAHLSRVAAD